eukprot:3143981-Pyramimonas_sp.AAC.1
MSLPQVKLLYRLPSKLRPVPSRTISPLPSSIEKKPASAPPTVLLRAALECVSEPAMERRLSTLGGELQRYTCESLPFTWPFRLDSGRKGATSRIRVNSAAKAD